ncbi:MAG: radical SAM protein [Desulfobulbus sp.]|jgi:MoaA/NifB/PqqE/SkfB family radical SAM enzyme
MQTHISTEQSQELRPDIETNMKTMAALLSMERLAAQGAAAVPSLLAHVAGDQAVLAHAAMRLLFALLPTATLPTRWLPGEAAIVPPDIVSLDMGRQNIQPLTQPLPAWIRDNPFNLDEHASLCRLCAEQLQGLPAAASRSRFVQRLALLAGAQHELSAYFVSQGLAREAEELNRAVASLAAQRYPQQISFSPSMRCQLHCSYCIAGADNSTSAEQEADEKQLAALLAWMKKYRLTRLGLTGGEPTLYSRFSQLISWLHKAGLEYYVASNGLMEEPALAAILANPPLCITLHLTPEVLHAPSAYQRFTATARRLRQAGIYAILRCNFLSPADDALAYLHSAQACGLHELRIAIPMPNSQRGNDFVDINQLATFAPLLHRLVLEAEKQGMQVQLSKPFPICCMPEQVAWHFLKNGSLACVCPSYLLGFSNNVVVYPDLHFSACLGLNRRSRQPITACAGPEAAAQVFAPDIANRMRSPIMAQCNTCPLGVRGQCIGACLSYRPAAACAPFSHAHNQGEYGHG